MATASLQPWWPPTFQSKSPELRSSLLEVRQPQLGRYVGSAEKERPNEETNTDVGPPWSWSQANTQRKLLCHAQTRYDGPDPHPTHPTSSPLPSLTQATITSSVLDCESFSPQRELVVCSGIGFTKRRREATIGYQH